VSPAAQKKVGFSETALAAEAVAVGEEVATDRRCAHAARRPPRGARGDERTARRQGGGWRESAATAAAGTATEVMEHEGKHND
jgi:hypothetical protein